MTRCHQAGCLSTDLKCFKLALRNHYVLLCAACAADLSGLGLALIPVERRETVMPVLIERRQTARPVWLRTLKAKVMDHGSTAA